MTMVYFGLLVIAVAIAFLVGRNRAKALKAGGSSLHSLPSYHGAFVAMCVGLPMLVAFIVWMPTARMVIDNRAIAQLAGDARPSDPLAREARLRDIDRIGQGGMTDEQIATYPETVVQAGRSAATMRAWSFAGLLAVGLGLGALGFHYGRQRINPQFRARNVVERAVKGLLVACSFVAVMTTVGIVMSVLFETMRFFAKVPPGDFLFGLQWSPQTALRADQVGSSGAFGAVPLFAGTMLIMVIAMLVAGPVGLFAAIYMAEYATPKFRAWVKPIIVLMNEHSYSNAEIFPYAMRARKLAKLVGMPTPGYVIWTDTLQLVDGTGARMPQSGFYRLDGTTQENSGEQPDVRVPLSPEDWLKGRDPQVDRAIELLQRPGAVADTAGF